MIFLRNVELPPWYGQCLSLQFKPISDTANRILSPHLLEKKSTNDSFTLHFLATKNIETEGRKKRIRDTK